MSGEQITKYETWAAKLEQNIVDLGKQRSTFFRIFFGAVVLSAVGFFVGPWLGVATFFTGVMVCVAGIYISTTRTWEYQRELDRTREEIARLRGEAPPARRQSF
jgi:hypothetical protein